MPLGPWEPHPQYSGTEIRKNTETGETFVTLFPEGRGKSVCWCWTFADHESGSRRGREEARSIADERASEKFSSR